MSRDNLNFISELALTFRLSEKSLIKIFKKYYDIDLNGIVDKLMTTFSENQFAYQYLFYEETSTETESESKKKETLAGFYLRKLNSLDPNSDEYENEINKLNKVESDFNDLFESKILSEGLSPANMLIIEKYRLKHAMTMKRMSDITHINESSLRSAESRIQDQKLIEKLKNLNEYNSSILLQIKRGTR